VKDYERFWKRASKEDKKFRRREVRLPFAKKLLILEGMQEMTEGI